MNRPAKALAVALALGVLSAAAPALALGPDSYAARTLQFPEFFGTVEVTVDPAATAVTVTGTGDPAKLKEVTVSLSGDTLRIARPIPDGPKTIDMEKDDQPVLRLTVPAGTSVALGDYLGGFTAGDGLSALALDSGLAARLTLGRIGSVAVTARGAVQMTLAEVTESLDIDLRGAGQMDIGSTSGPVRIDIRGMGNVDVGRVQGPVAIAIAGAGMVAVDAGRADPLSVTVSGLARVAFEGEAVNPAVSKTGLASVSIAGRSH